MTLAIALRCADGLVMASDSRLTGGPRQSADISEKFLQVNRDVGVMTYGLAVPGYRGIRRLVEEAREEPSRYPTMNMITTRATEVFRDVYKEYRDQQRLEDGSLPPGLEEQGVVGFLIGGYDGNDTAQFRIYSCSNVEDFAFAEQLGPNVIAAQWHLPQWLFPFLGYPGMSVQRGLHIVTTLMVLTSTFEPTVGGPIHLATVTLGRGFTVLHEQVVDRLTEEIQPLLLGLKQAWIESW